MRAGEVDTNLGDLTTGTELRLPIINKEKRKKKQQKGSKYLNSGIFIVTARIIHPGPESE